MKLISKTLLYYLLVNLPLLALAGVFSYYVIKSELRDGTDESLLKEVENRKQFLEHVKDNKPFFLSSDSLSFIKTTAQTNNNTIFFDKKSYDKNEDEFVYYRGINFYTNYNNKSYVITLLKNTLQEDELMEGLFSTFILISVFLVLAFFIVNWFVSKTLWKPFYKTLHILNNYQLNHHQPAQFETVNTKEFNKLNQVLDEVMKKNYLDYSKQKEFTENASHEMQTPLAVIKATLDLLIQSTHLQEKEMNQLQTIEKTIKKMELLNKSLILLAKIDNHQFKLNETISVKDTITKVVEQYDHFIEAKSITLITEMNTDLLLNINSSLVEILITNLLQNAIRHNFENGSISIQIQNNTLTFSNTGNPLTISETDLFTRFKKNDDSKDSLGLGLSIVKGILDNYNYIISYQYTNQLHQFKIIF